MVAAMPLPAPASREDRAPELDDDLLTLHGITWDQYVTISDALGERGSVHLTYLKGTLEIMTTGRRHEVRKTTIGRLVEAYGDEMGVDLYGYGTMTCRKKAVERGLEPDESYAVRRLGDDEFPDLAVEVVMTHGSIDKLEVYAGLGVSEVWFWEKGKIAIHWLGPNGYEARTKSRILPDLDVAELETFASSEDQPGAARAYRARLRDRAATRR